MPKVSPLPPKVNAGALVKAAVFIFPWKVAVPVL
jgi:hypothetical protein